MSDIRHDTHAISVNQNQGGTVYPFLHPCEQAGLVSDVWMTFAYDPNEVTTSVYLSVARNAGIPRLAFTNEHGTVLLATEELALLHAEQGLWFFSDLTGARTVRYSEYADVPVAPSDVPPTSPAEIVPRCWAVCRHGFGYSVDDAETGLPTRYAKDTLFLALESPLDCAVTSLTDATEVLLFDTEAEEAPEALPPIIQTVNGLRPNVADDFIIRGDGRSLITTALLDGPGHLPGDNLRITGIPNGVGIRNDSTACCSCEDYAEKFLALDLLYREHNYNVAYLEYQKAYYDALLNRYRERTEARLSETVQLEGVTRGGKYLWAISVGNPTGHSSYNVVATLSVPRDYISATYTRNAEIRANGAVTELHIPELKAHSRWVCYAEIHVDDAPTLTVSLPWFAGTVEGRFNRGSDDMPWSDPVNVPSPTIPLPTPPRRSDFGLD